MLQFPEDYFKSQERSGYMVGEAIKRVWAAQIEILQKVIDICEKHNITYYVFWGTLLGAVRHQGFIPWDDDIDIAMLGEDYVRFLEVAEKELPEGYHVFNPYTDDGLDSHFTRITNRKAIDLVGGWSKEYHGCPLSMGIDIFPLYYIPRDKRMAEEQKQILSFIKHLKDIINFRNTNRELNDDEKKEYDLVIAQSLVDVQSMTGYQFTTNRPLIRQLDIVFDQISRIAMREESDCAASFDVYVLNGKCVFELKLLEETVKLPFENIMVTAPKEYDAILRDVYSDYMVPRNYNKVNEHAAIKSQMQRLGKQLEGVYFQRKNGGNAVNIKLDDIPKERMSYEQAQEMLPSDWLDRIYVLNSNGSIIRKPVMLYYLAVDKLLFNSAHVIDKIERTFTTFKNQSDVVIWWMPSIGVDDIAVSIKDFVPETMEGYKKLVSEYISQNIGIYDDSGNILRAITMSDAYYGDEGILVSLYTKMGKPVMIQDYLV